MDEETTLVQDAAALAKIKAVWKAWKEDRDPFGAYNAMMDIGRIVAAAILITGFWLAFFYALPGCLA